MVRILDHNLGSYIEAPTVPLACWDLPLLSLSSIMNYDSSTPPTTSPLTGEDKTCQGGIMYSGLSVRLSFAAPARAICRGVTNRLCVGSRVVWGPCNLRVTKAIAQPFIWPSSRFPVGTCYYPLFDACSVP